MVKKLAEVALILFATIFMASTAFAQTTTNTDCTARSNDGSRTDINCTSISQTAPSAADNAAAIEQARKNRQEMGEDANKLGQSLGTLGQAIAARHEANIRQEQENDKAVNYVVNCQKDSKLSAESNGKILPCTDYIPKVREWCVKHKNKFNYCKALETVPAAPPIPDSAKNEPRVP
jgi:hypothetical protein